MITYADNDSCLVCKSYERDPPLKKAEVIDDPTTTKYGMMKIFLIIIYELIAPLIDLFCLTKILLFKPKSHRLQFFLTAQFHWIVNAQINII